MLMAHGPQRLERDAEHTVRIYARAEEEGRAVHGLLPPGRYGGPPPMNLLNRWFTRFLYDVDNGIEKEPKAWIVRESDRKDDPTPYARLSQSGRRAGAAAPAGRRRQDRRAGVRRQRR
ncbi:MAG: hypothetical protein R3F29_05650 [Planctomycetota bacterium]